MSLLPFSPAAISDVMKRPTKYSTLESNECAPWLVEADVLECELAEVVISPLATESKECDSCLEGSIMNNGFEVADTVVSSTVSASLVFVVASHTAEMIAVGMMLHTSEYDTVLSVYYADLHAYLFSNIE